MPSVTIDAGILAVPHLDASPEDSYSYVETILDWHRLLDEPWVAIYMSEQASEVLLEDGLYPFRDHLRKLFSAHGVLEYDVNTVAQVIERLLRLTPHFETFFKVRNVLTDRLSTVPDILKLSSGSRLQSDLARCVVLIAILRGHCKQPVRDHSMILRYAPRRVIDVQALVYDLEHDRDDLNAIPVPPQYFEGDVLVCDDFRGLIEYLDEGTIFVNSSDAVGMETAIRVALYKSRLERGVEPDWDDVRGLRIGRHFHETAMSIACSQPTAFVLKVLRAVVETLDGLNMAAVHALRTGPGAGDPQRTRGEDRAMRRDIDREYHLHYWKCENGTIELASIVVHNDFSIPE